MDLNFGKYSFYILTSFGATFVVLLGLTIDTLWRSRRWRLEAERLEAERAAHKSAKAAK